MRKEWFIKAHETPNGNRNNTTKLTTKINTLYGLLFPRKSYLDTKMMIMNTQLAYLKQPKRWKNRFQSLLIMLKKTFNGSWLLLLDVHRLRIVIVIRASVFSRTIEPTMQRSPRSFL